MKNWRTIEKEDFDVEGYILVPIDGSYSKYLAKGPFSLWKTEAAARKALSNLVSQQKVSEDELRIVRAKLTHHRMMKVYAAPVRLVVDNA